MRSAPVGLSRLRILGLRGLHGLLAVIRMKRAVHLLITGPDLRGREYLGRQLRLAVPEWNLPESERLARATFSDFAPMVVSWHPQDDVDVESVRKTVGSFRRLLVLSVVADPRDLVCEQDSLVPQQFVDSGDYRILVGPEGLRSLTEPGVIPRFEALQRWRDLLSQQSYLVTRESLANDLVDTVHNIVNWVGLRRRGRGSSSAVDRLHVVPEMLPSSNFSKNPKTRQRALSQCQRHPALEKLAEDYGYPPLGKALGKAPKKKAAGTVIAFHTPDAVYRAEAERLKSSLEALGIPYRFYEVSPEKNWVRTTLLKPSWIIPAREELNGELLYIDVDAFVHQDPWPYLADYDGDMAAVVYRNGQLNSATLWINDTPGARAILRRWKELADARRGADHGDLEATGDNGDQGVLKQAVLEDEQSATPRFRFQRLPVNLAYIFDRTDTYCVGPILIEQLQASRESLGHNKRLARRRARLQELRIPA